MASLCECRLFNRAFAIDDISKKPYGKNLKFKRAFQFLQLLLIQRAYGQNIVACSTLRRSLRHQQRMLEKEEQQNYQVFLGGSCNPTTWRHDQAIPYFLSRSVSFYNPQVADWTPDLVEIEHRAKELAPLLFFVIDYDTRALASIVEVCYLAARGRSTIVVMSPMPEKNSTKFIQQKTIQNEKDNEEDYKNVCEARQIVQQLLHTRNIPVFENIPSALDCAAYILETTKRTVTNEADNYEDKNEDNDILTPLPSSPGDLDLTRSKSSVVVIRSLSNKTSFDSADEFYQQMNQSGSSPTSPNRRSPPVSESINHQFRPLPTCPKSQISCSTNESDDDGYGSLSSSNRTLSVSTSSISSEFESTIEHSREETSTRSHSTAQYSMFNQLLSKCYSYMPFVGYSNSPVTQSIFVLFTLPFRFLTTAILSPSTSLSLRPLPSPSQKPVQSEIFSSIPSSPSDSMFDLYIASGENDECWLNTFALPLLKSKNITFTKRNSYPDIDQIDAVYEISVRQRSRVLFYLINGNERLSHLAAELAFLIGERKHQIFVYLQSTIDENAPNISSPCERRDLHRSRKYLEDIARKEKNIRLFHSREQTYEEIVEFFQNDDQ